MKVAIAGYGVEGEVNYRYWAANPENEVTIVDEKETPDAAVPHGAATLLGPDSFSKLDEFDVVVRTAGLPPRKIHTNGTIWSGTNEFFSKCKAPIIGVTGSKGKGTTASFIVSILEAAGKKVWFVGNIGKPGLEIVHDIQPDDIVVYELSSFQLWDAQYSPHVAVVLYIEQEHLNVHTDMDEYVAAKAHITTNQSPEDVLVYNGANEYAQRIASRTAARTIPYPSDEAAHIQDGDFYYGTQKLCSTAVLKLRGGHNQSNALAAIDAVWGYVQNADVIEKGLSSFTGLPHRFAFVKEVNGVSYYDDSIATTPGSAIAALRAFDSNVPKVIILGGSVKGSDFSVLARELPEHDVRAILMGAEAATIAAACDAVNFKNYEIWSDSGEGTPMQQLVRRASQLARPGGVVLLSPSAASIGMFKNYADRGDQFIAAVESL